MLSKTGRISCAIQRSAKRKGQFTWQVKFLLHATTRNWSIHIHIPLQPKTSQKRIYLFTSAITQHVPCCWKLSTHLKSFDMLFKFQHIAVFHGASQGPSNPTGYCHVLKHSDGHWYCTSNSCKRKSGNSKQVKVRRICAHLHVLYCILRLSSIPPDTPSPSDASTVVSSTLDLMQDSLGVSRSSTISLNLKRKVPYPVPQEVLTACCDLSDISCFVPSQTMCDLCASLLSAGRRHPGQGPDDVSYLLTTSIFRAVEIQVKFCMNKDCKAMHQVWPINQGKFL